MIAQHEHEHQVLTTEQRRDLNRQHALYEVYSLTAAGLSPLGERDVRSAVERHVDALLQLADSATVALLEYEATDRQLDVHVREEHRGCSVESPCLRFRLLVIRREKLWRKWTDAYRALMAGRR